MMDCTSRGLWQWALPATLKQEAPMRSSNFYSIFGAVGMTILALLALSACGGDDDDDDDIVEQAEDADEGAADDGEEDAVEEEVEEEVEAEAEEEADDDGEEVDACSLLTVDEASALLGEEAGEPEAGSQTPPFAVCSWAAEAQDSFSIIVMQILTDFPGGAEAFYDNVIEGLDQANEDYEEVSGLGDEAVYYAGLLQVRDGDDLIAASVTIEGADEATNRDKSEEAAELALEKLD
jgi:hypothetical protein